MEEQNLNALVISDSHGNINFLQNIVKKAKEIANIEQIWHLGDEYEDMDYIDFDGIVKKIPGTRHPDYYSGALSKFLSFPFSNAEITIVHSPYDIPNFLICQKRLFFYGHLHRSNIAKSGNGLLISPGHIKCPFDRGYEASFLIAEFSQTIKLKQYDYSGKFKAEAIVKNLENRYELSQIKGSPIGWKISEPLLK
ncbi:MAG: metallophosphatase family protein [Chitinispirillales bacterium]|jgi:predicted phosphodiesterase|nr:metallophosphatase family protein [Chitinispirillales bacterium]